MNYLIVIWLMRPSSMLTMRSLSEAKFSSCVTITKVAFIMSRNSKNKR